MVFSKQKSKRTQGGDKALPQSRMYKQSKNSQELWKDNVEESRQVKINQVSELIIRKMGKNRIIETMSKKFQ